MTTRQARCSCGQLAVTVTGEPVRVSICHCLDCQRRSGSAFAAQARFHDDQAQVSGQARDYTHVGDSGNRATRSFCPTCGVTVFYRLEQEPGLVAVALGTFADPTFPAPRVSVYEERRHPWVGLPADIEHIA